MTQEALKLALEALEELFDTNGYWWQEVDEQTLEKIEHSITAIKEALAQPEQEPVAKYSDIVSDGGLDPRNTTPPQRSESSGKPSAWIGLTDEEVKDIVWNLPYEPSQEHIRAIEAKLREKNSQHKEKNT